MRHVRGNDAGRKLRAGDTGNREVGRMTASGLSAQNLTEPCARIFRPAEGQRKRMLPGSAVLSVPVGDGKTFQAEREGHP